MAEARDGHRTSGNSFPWSMPQFAGNPLLAIVTDMNGKWLESVAGAQKEWVEFVHRRVKEDIAASQQLINCQSLTDMQQIYSQYFQTAFEQYQEQSKRVVQRGKSMTGELAESMETRAGNVAQRARH